jgi:branched chain amino acid efflux pump
MDTLTAFALIGVLALASFVPRASFILWLHRVQIPTTVQRALRFVPAAVFTALVVPQLVFVDGVANVGLHNPQLIAGCVAAGVAAATRNPLATIATGMLVLHLARNFLGP